MAWALPDGSVLGVLGEQPDPQRTDSRLAAEFGAEVAAEIHEAMLFDVLDTWSSQRVLAPGGRRVMVFAPAEAGPWFDQRVPETFALQPQAEGDLGNRLHSFFAGEFEDGAERVVLIGSNSPTLDPSIVISAFLCLEGRDVVLGPSTGGGCYLVGCRRSVPALFEGIVPGTVQVLAQAVERLRGSGHSLAVLPPWYGVEGPESWRMLAGHIRALQLAGTEVGLPRTEDLVERIA